jgi:hypothetical protein
VVRRQLRRDGNFDDDDSLVPGRNGKRTEVGGRSSAMPQESDRNANASGERSRSKAKTTEEESTYINPSLPSEGMCRTVSSPLLLTKGCHLVL